jgi:hypothetical protein
VCGLQDVEELGHVVAPRWEAGPEPPDRGIGPRLVDRLPPEHEVAERVGEEVDVSRPRTRADVVVAKSLPDPDAGARPSCSQRSQSLAVAAPSHWLEELPVPHQNPSGQIRAIHPSSRPATDTDSHSAFGKIGDLVVAAESASAGGAFVALVARQA